jgi:hypothetical protein
MSSCMTGFSQVPDVRYREGILIIGGLDDSDVVTVFDAVESRKVSGTGVWREAVLWTRMARSSRLEGAHAWATYSSSSGTWTPCSSGRDIR